MPIANRDERGMIAPKYTSKDLLLIKQWLDEGMGKHEIISNIILGWKVSEITAQRWIKRIQEGGL